MLIFVLLYLNIKVETLISGKCICNKISGCEDCIYDSKVCKACVSGKVFNPLSVICVDACPSGTHL